jgi:transcriptional regulator with XRE-family HTH domain
LREIVEGSKDMAHNVDEEREYQARQLREARDYLGLSQDYVSQETGIPRPAISEIEAGRRKVESLELNRLAALYGRPIEYFFLTEKRPRNDESQSSSAMAEKNDPVEIKLRNMTKKLTPEDRDEILRFAEYLRHKKAVAERG